MPLLKRLFKKMIPYWYWVLPAMVSALAVMGLNLAIPQFIRLVIDRAIVGGQAFYLPWMALGVVLVTVLKGIFSFIERFFMERVSQKVVYNLRNDLYNHLQRMSFSYFDSAQTGQLMSRATADVEMVRKLYGFGMINLFQSALTFLGVVVVIFTMHWRLSLVVMVTLPLIAVAIFRFGRMVGPAYQKIQEELADLTSVLQENLSGIRVVKAFAREEGEKEKFDRHNRELLRKNLAAVRIWAFHFPFLSFLTGLAAAFLLWFGGREVISGNLLIGELVAFNSYLLMMIMPMRMFGWLVNMSQRAVTSAARVFEVLDREPDVRDLPNATDLKNIRGEVVFEKVSFSYRQGVDALKEVSFRALPGQTVAIVGTTGSGKTTLVNLIPRFYNVTSGRILIDGTDISGVTLSSLRSAIGFVPQETFLFSATIAENIGYGKPGAGRSEIVAAAQAAQIHDFIMTLPDGYETVVGERGIGLSGGQKQRVAIARALLRDPKILILDDYTSNVDVHTEYLIRQALDRLMDGRTSFIIAQRVSTVAAADLILVLDRGEVVAMGKHRELLSKSPLYREIYELQIKGHSVGEEEDA